MGLTSLDVQIMAGFMVTLDIGGNWQGGAKSLKILYFLPSCKDLSSPFDFCQFLNNMADKLRLQWNEFEDDVPPPTRFQLISILADYSISCTVNTQDLSPCLNKVKGRATLACKVVQSLISFGLFIRVSCVNILYRYV